MTSATQHTTWLRFHVFQAKIEKKYTPVMKRVIGEQIAVFNAHAKEVGYDKAASQIYDYFDPAPIMNVVNDIHYECAGKWGASVYNEFKNVKQRQSVYAAKLYSGTNQAAAGFKANSNALVSCMVQYKRVSLFGVQDEIAKQIISELRLSLLNNVHGITDSIKEQILYYIQQGQINGWSYDETAAKISQQVGSAYRSQRIVRTESVKASNMGGMAGAQRTGLLMDKTWINAKDIRVRGNPAGKETQFDHWDMGGVTLPIEQPFLLGSRVTGGSSDSLQFPGDPKGNPADIINCFPADTLCEGQIISGQRLKYSGKLIEIITISGKRLSVTPNHPIFSSKGTIPAKLLTKGDYVISNVKKDNSVLTLVDDYIEKKPVIAAQIFRTLNNFFTSEQIMITGLEFNGDGQFGNGNIEIVDMNRELNLDCVTSFKDFGKVRFKSTALEGIFIRRLCANLQLIGSSRNPFDSGMSGFDLVAPFINRHLRPFKYFSIGTSTYWNASRFETPSEYGTSDATFIRELLHGNSGNIEFDEIIEVRNYDYLGHVYDFSTITGAILLNNIYTSNCRCTLGYTPRRDENGLPIIVRPRPTDN